MANPGVIKIEAKTMSTKNGEEVQEDESLEHRALIDEAKHNVAHQRELTIRQAIRCYRWAIFWCLAISMTVIMEGYDTILLGNFWAYPTFQRKYGTWVGVSETTRSGYQLTPAWQAALANGAGIGAFFGALANGYLVHRLGQKKAVVGALVMMVFSIFAVFFAQNVQILLVGQVLCGLPWGVFASSCPAYASEMLPMKLRVYFTSWTNMCFIIGQFLASGVLRACLLRDDEWGFRIPFALQWFWPLWLIPLLCFAPESPWHLVRKGQLDEAERSLRRLQDPATPVSPRQALAYIVYTNNLEQELSVGTSYRDCFRGFELRRTEIAALSFSGQVLCGTALAYNATYFYEQIGLPASQIYTFNLAGYALALTGAFCSWFLLLPRLGRRTIYLWGSGAMGLLLYLIAALTSWKSRVGGVAESQAYLTMLWKFVFQLSAGQLGWAIPSEVGSTRVRQKTVVLARNAYYLVNLVANILQPYLMNPTAWNVGARTGFFWGSTALLFFVWAFWRLPETKDRTYEELDILFAKRTPARMFKSTKIDLLNQEEAHVVKQVS